MGLSDSQQSLLSVISAILIALAGVSVPIGAPWYVALILGIVGAMGFGIKEALGSKPKPLSP